MSNQRILLSTYVTALLISSFWTTIAEAQQFDLRQQDRAVEAVCRQVEPSIVRFETIGGLEKIDSKVVYNGPSSGVIVTKDGFVISAAINFAHQPAAIFARLSTGERLPAEIVCKDTNRNLVLLKIGDSRLFQVPSTVSRRELRVGQSSIAVGRVFDQASLNISTGIVSATNRIWGKAVQTDAKISQVNYGGPLLDFQGRVIGILVPLSPDDEGVFAGTDWYDSGIGFAVPLDEILPRLEIMKSKPVIRAGRLGLTLKGSDIYADPATIAYCPGSSPAWTAGIRPGDTIVSCNQLPIVRQSQLKHALGPLYENDVVDISVDRDGQLQNFRIELAGEIEVYQPTGIGFLPESKSKSAAVVVRHVFKSSAAAAAGLQVGDEIAAAGGKPCRDADEFHEVVALRNAGEQLALTINRGGREQEIAVQIQKQSSVPPRQLKPPTGKRAAAADWQIKDLEVSEFANVGHALVPPETESLEPAGVLVWIPKPGKFDRDQLIKSWRERCVERNLILLIPQSRDKDRWRPDEVEFVTKALTNLQKSYRTDTSRVLIGGLANGGAMAALVAAERRDLFRGLILLDSGVPDRMEKMEASPVNPMLVFVGSTTTFESKSEFVRLLNLLKKSKIPFTHQKLQSQSPATWISDIVLWSDAINRL